MIHAHDISATAPMERELLRIPPVSAVGDGVALK
jgi:hypothetical protein